MAQNYEDPSRKKDGHLFNTIVCNRNKSACYTSIERVFYDHLKEGGNGAFKKTPVCSAMFRGHAEVDMIELRALKKILDRRGKIDKIDEQTMTC